MVITPMTIMPIASMVKTMTTILSSLPPIEVAEKTQTRVFVLYIVVLILAGLFTAGLTVWLWLVTNRYHDVIKLDADAQIAAARENAAIANERAAQLEVTAKELQQRNLELSRDVQIETSKRLTLERSLQPRSISPESVSTVIETLRPFQRQKVQLTWLANSADSVNFGKQVERILLSAGWMVFGSALQRHAADIPTGVFFSTLNPESRRPSVLAFEKAFKSVIPGLCRCPNFSGVLPFAEFRGIDGSTAKASEVSPDEVIVFWIGLKPAPQVQDRRN